MENSPHEILARQILFLEIYSYLYIKISIINNDHEIRDFYLIHNLLTAVEKTKESRNVSIKTKIKLEKHSLKLFFL